METKMIILFTVMTLVVFATAIPLEKIHPKLTEMLDIPELNLARKGNHLIIGNPEEGDSILCVKKVVLFPEEHDVVLKNTLNCPSEGETNEREITSVQVWDLNILQGGGEDPKILSGGLGEKQVSVEVSSPKGGFLAYALLVFVK